MPYILTIEIHRVNIPTQFNEQDMPNTSKSMNNRENKIIAYNKQKDISLIQQNS